MAHALAPGTERFRVARYLSVLLKTGSILIPVLQLSSLVFYGASMPFVDTFVGPGSVYSYMVLYGVLLIGLTIEFVVLFGAGEVIDAVLELHNGAFAVGRPPA